MTALGYPAKLQDPDRIWRLRELAEGLENARRRQEWARRWEWHRGRQIMEKGRVRLT